MKHEWVKPSDLGYRNIGDYVSCRKCGVVRNDRNADNDNCRGVVPVGLRAIDAVAALLTEGHSDECQSTTTVVDVFVKCDREHGHGGAHHARIDRNADPYWYEVSWWPTPTVGHSEGSSSATGSQP